MIPLHDDNPTYRLPILTIALIVTCFAVFMYQQSLPADASREGQTAFLCSYGAVPANTLDTAPDANTNTPGIVTCYEVSREQGRLLGLVSYQFLHGGWLHLLGNMLFLWVFGNNIEDRIGRLRFMPFYLLCGVVAALAQAFTDPTSDIPMVGASGAVSGMLGAYLVLYPRAGVWTLVGVIPVKVPAWLWIGFYFILQFSYLGQQLTGGDTGTAYAAHVAGFLFGALAIRWALTGRPSWPPRDNRSPIISGGSH